MFFCFQSDIGVLHLIMLLGCTLFADTKGIKISSYTGLLTFELFIAVMIS